MTLLALGMDLLLASLLTAAVIIGVRLNGRLKGLRQGQDQFVAAVADLDAAAAKAERALSALKSASEEAHDALMARIETARALTRTLETATADAHSAARRAQHSERPQPPSSLPAARSPLAGEAPGQAPGETTGETTGQTFERPSGDAPAPALSLKAALHRASQSRGTSSRASSSLTFPFRASPPRARDVQVSQPEASSPPSVAQPGSPGRRTSGAGDQPLPPLGERRRAMEARFPPLLGARGVQAPAALAEPIAGRPPARPPARPAANEADDLFDDSLWPAASLNPSTGRAR
jgi:hypothetical protein